MLVDFELLHCPVSEKNRTLCQLRVNTSIHCFDTVVWAARRTFGLLVYKTGVLVFWIGDQN